MKAELARGDVPRSAYGVRAFTLVELLIVIVLVAIAATLALPMMGDSGATRLPAAARLLLADLAFAQVQSISHADDPCVVIFDSASDTYTLEKSSTPGTPMTDSITGQPYVTHFGSGRASEMADVSIQGYSLGGDDRVSFGMYGELDQTTTATITLKAGALTTIIQIDPDSGEAVVQ